MHKAKLMSRGSTEVELDVATMFVLLEHTTCSTLTSSVHRPSIVLSLQEAGALGRKKKSREDSHHVAAHVIGQHIYTSPLNRDVHVLLLQEECLPWPGGNHHAVFNVVQTNRVRGPEHVGTVLKAVSWKSRGPHHTLSVAICV